ncbi:hypothetical protein F5B22DRAFT_568158 [Xylaria bambusicola]|uniref:uncharacterized protein n=1 Tax=Xylaria bambusicola TaxID=326684 RepID=UPI002007E123|nr:uncharacterized protein F5B22DRAFT_568158 [Xylaria bambusicola]KAI0521284.1 hypothetical protein F5B22DRAFT_568158 [Xylaria bambusicola]
MSSSAYSASQTQKIYWGTPATLWATFFAAIALVIGHHAFYQSLSGTVAPAGLYDLAWVTFSRQQLNLAIGSALAVIIKSLLFTSFASSYTQIFWRSLKSASHGIRLVDADATSSLLNSFDRFCTISIWRRHRLLSILAGLFWLLPLPFILTPTTLTIQALVQQPNPAALSHVPQFDFVNPNFCHFFPDDPTYKTYNKGGRRQYYGPSERTQRLVAATAAQGVISRITPPALNSSWGIQFWGPSLRCQEVPSEAKVQVLGNYALYINDTIERGFNSPLAYFSWTSHLGLNPFERFSDVSSINMVHMGDDDLIQTATLYLAFDSEFEGYFTTETYMDAINATSGEPEALLRAFGSFNIVECDLHNASYHVNFRYTNGDQDIKVTQHSLSPKPVRMKGFGVYYPTRSNETWGSGPFDRVEAQVVSYQALKDAFAMLLVGMLDFASASNIINTVLMDTNELRFRYEKPLITDVSTVSPALQGIPIQKLNNTRGPLLRALEQLFENITIGILSDTYLQPDYASQTSPPPLANVTYETYRNIYVYNAFGLWVAYGAVLLITGVAIAIGQLAMVRSKVAYDLKLSTILRAARIHVPGTASGIEAEPLDQFSDDGRKPLPKSLVKANIIVRKTKPQPNS